MLIIPLGDNVEKRSLPLVATYMIIVNCLVHAYATRLWATDVELGNMETLPMGGSVPESWWNFINTWGLVPIKVVEDGQFHGFFTCMFLHGDIFHLLGNMLIFWVFSRTLEDVMGVGKFLTMYIIAGLAGSFAHYFVAIMGLPNEQAVEVPSIGASGAIFGVIGAYLYRFGPLTRLHILVIWPIFIIPPSRFKVPAGIFIFFYFVLDLAWGLGGTLEGAVDSTAHFAHGGGFLGGLLFMALFGKSDAYVDQEREGELVVKTDKMSKTQKMYLEKQQEIQKKFTGVDCPHCGYNPLTKEHKFSDGLRRCPQCAMLVQVDDSQDDEDVFEET